jgi:hypothetical protein
MKGSLLEMTKKDVERMTMYNAADMFVLESSSDSDGFELVNANSFQDVKPGMS